MGKKERDEIKSDPNEAAAKLLDKVIKGSDKKKRKKFKTK